MTPATGPSVVPGYRAGRWKVDPSGSRIEFAIRQLFSKAHGRFNDYDIALETGERVTESSVVTTLRLASIDTGNAKRDTHLRGPAILDVDQGPTITYRSTGLRQADSGVVVDGDLTIRGITKPVPLVVEGQAFRTDPSGAAEASFVASAQVSERAFGVAIPMECAGLVIGDKVTVRAHLRATLHQVSQ